MLNNLPMNFVVVGELELEQFVKAWLVGTNGWLDGSKPIECEQDEHDEAQEVWEQREDLLEGAFQETSGIWEV